MNETSVSTPPATPTPPTKPKFWTKKKLLILVLIVILVAGVAVWFVLKSSNDLNQSQSQSNTQNATEQSKTLTPSAVAYSYSTDGPTNTGSCTTSQAKAYWRPLSGGNRVDSTDFGQNSTVGFSGVYKNQVFVVTTPTCTTSEGPSIWYSSDAGTTYAKIYTGKSAVSGDSFPDTVTSAMFSTDGSRIVLGYLPSVASGISPKNTVKSLNPSNKQATDLFSVDAAGVFVSGYDVKTQKVLYYTGCYFCDGNGYNKLFEHDGANDTTTILYEDSDHLGAGTVPNDDLSKLLLVKGMQGDFLGSGKPYTIQEFTVATKSTKDLVTIDEDTAPSVGYREGDNSIYYTTGNSILGYNASAKPTTLFEATKPIMDVLYVGKDDIVASSGLYNKYLLTNYKVSTNTTTTILNGDDKTTLYGVVWK